MMEALNSIVTLASALARLIGACEGMSHALERADDTSMQQIGTLLRDEAEIALKELRRIAPSA